MSMKTEIIPNDEKQLQTLSFIVRELSIFYFFIVFSPNL